MEAVSSFLNKDISEHQLQFRELLLIHCQRENPSFHSVFVSCYSGVIVEVLKRYVTSRPLFHKDFDKSGYTLSLYSFIVNTENCGLVF